MSHMTECVGITGQCAQGCLFAEISSLLTREASYARIYDITHNSNDNYLYSYDMLDPLVARPVSHGERKTQRGE